MHPRLYLYVLFMAYPLHAFCWQPEPLHPTQCVSVGIAFYTSDYLMDGYHPGKPTTYDYVNKGNPFAFFVSYSYRPARRIYVSFTELIEEQYGDWQNNSVYDYYYLSTLTKGAFVRNAFTSAAEFRWDCVSDGLYKQYMTAGLGFTYQQETDQYNADFYATGYQNGVNRYGPIRASNNQIHFNGYISPLGISIGNKLCYNLQLGFGYKGIVNTGFSYHF